MAQYTWRVPTHRFFYVRNLLADSAEATRRHQVSQLRQLTDLLKSIPGFPLSARPGDQITVEEVRPVISISRTGKAQAQRRLVRANGTPIH